MSRIQDTNKRLTTIAQYLENASEALSEVLSQGEEEESRTVDFERQYTKVQANFMQFREEALSQQKQASKLKSRLMQEVMKRQNTVGSLKSEIISLNEQIKQQELEIERLGREHRDKVHQYSQNCSHANSIAQRLSEENQ